MISEQLEEQAALYAAGTLTTRERAQFEVILDFHTELRALVDGLLNASAAVAAVLPREAAVPSGGLKDRIMGAIQNRAQAARAEAFVLTGPDGLVQWVNPAFTAMCGYEPGELLGKKPGSILQGKLTDEAAVLRIREALRDRRPCTEALVNYHKNGTPYWVSVNITPVHDDAGGLLCFIARELELTERAVAA